MENQLYIIFVLPHERQKYFLLTKTDSFTDKLEVSALSSNLKLSVIPDSSLKPSVFGSIDLESATYYDQRDSLNSRKVQMNSIFRHNFGVSTNSSENVLATQKEILKRRQPCLRSVVCTDVSRLMCPGSRFCAKPAKVPLFLFRYTCICQYLDFFRIPLRLKAGFGEGTNLSTDSHTRPCIDLIGCAL